MEQRRWRIDYVSGESTRITADRYVDVGEWVDFLLEDGTLVRRERATGIARIILKGKPSQAAGGDESPPAES
jgi:hypothetical protein